MLAQLSVQTSQDIRPVMIVGQDESVFSQYLLGSKTWLEQKGINLSFQNLKPMNI